MVAFVEGAPDPVLQHLAGDFGINLYERSFPHEHF